MSLYTMVPCVMAQDSHGLCSYGLYSYGPFATALYMHPMSQPAPPGHNYIGHNYIGHTYTGREYIGHLHCADTQPDRVVAPR